MEEVISKQMSLGYASKHFRISKTTLHNRLKGKHSQKNGRPTRLTEIEENYIVLVIQYCSDLGWPIGQDHAFDIVEEYIKNHRTIIHLKMEVEWHLSFRHRHQKELSLRKPETVTSARAKGLNRQTLDSFFDMLKTKLTDAGIRICPSRTYNLDETGFSTYPR